MLIQLALSTKRLFLMLVCPMFHLTSYHCICLTLWPVPSTGNYATVVSHNPDTKKTRIKLPSGSKKVIPSANRAMVGQYHSVCADRLGRLRGGGSRY